MTQQRLGQRLGIDRTTIVGLVDALVERGLVEQVRDPVDRRAYLLTRTLAGGSWGSGEQRAVLTELLARAVRGASEA